MKKEFRHSLEEKFKYSANGEFHEAEIIVVEAPKSSDFKDNLQFLDSLCNRAEMRSLKDIAPIIKEFNVSQEVKDVAKEQLEEKTEEDKALDAYNQIMSGLNQDEIKQLRVVIVELLKKSAKVDGTKNFEALFWEEMSIEDQRLIIGKYIENFTVSAQRKLKKV